MPTLNNIISVVMRLSVVMVVAISYSLWIRLVNMVKAFDFSYSFILAAFKLLLYEENISKVT